jgi:Amino acid permease
MRSLAEMVSVRPLSGALIDFPHTFVDPALGFAVGIMYWFVLLLLNETLGPKGLDDLTHITQVWPMLKYGNPHFRRGEDSGILCSRWSVAGG